MVTPPLETCCGRLYLRGREVSFSFICSQVTLLDEDMFDYDHLLALAPREPMYSHHEEGPGLPSDSESSEHNLGQ